MKDIDPKLENISTKIRDRLFASDETENYSSVILSVMIISVILTLVRVMQECNMSKIKLFNKKEKAYFMKKEIQNVCIKKSFKNFLNKIAGFFLLLLLLWPACECVFSDRR